MAHHFLLLQEQNMMRIRTTAAAAALAAAGLFAGAGAAAACDGPGHGHHGPSHGYTPAQVLAADCNSHTSQKGDFSSSFTGNVCINF
ncbi:hypothetical protein QNO07_04740 [Streptomyces sp. 549]|uniref:hypothetical protein n=1 Tax=Streptomyces sp. 549 TaxID=3049076 RepID=UPI0024C2B7BB|nr:hypothetical protein [Streptomyces sp. 549]MDK1472740.1 hypothetical protein [Streptomyces sp. 549]